VKDPGLRSIWAQLAPWGAFAVRRSSRVDYYHTQCSFASNNWFPPTAALSTHQVVCLAYSCVYICLSYCSSLTIKTLQQTPHLDPQREPK